ncbi:MAG: alpha/beta fold hydrolase [Proteobacteria bacterium]|jgi:pimeloyl-ACP methyl ester carboxylesterase|nr:alpha/beta fold hydrolase [Pseudomonadota bacterium]
MIGGRARRSLWAAAGLAAVGVGWTVYAAYQREIGAARARLASGSFVAETRCGPIEYATAGGGPPVLVVHGAGGGYDQGLDLGEPLVPKGFRVIAMSRFGYLRTPLPRNASAAAQADAHACLLDTLALPRVAVVGASAGAPSAMQFALRHPERCSALVLLVPATYTPRPSGASAVTPPMTSMPRWAQYLFEFALRSDFVFWAAERSSRATMIRTILGTPPEVAKRASAAERARVATVLGHILPIAPRRDGLLNDAAVVSSLERYGLERIAVPTLAISAADCLYGTFEGARYTAGHVPGARFIGYETGGHLCVGHQDDVVSEIAVFLSESV